MLCSLVHTKCEQDRRKNHNHNLWPSSDRDILHENMHNIKMLHTMYKKNCIKMAVLYKLYVSVLRIIALNCNEISNIKIMIYIEHNCNDILSASWFELIFENELAELRSFENKYLANRGVWIMACLMLMIAIMSNISNSNIIRVLILNVMIMMMMMIWEIPVRHLTATKFIENRDIIMPYWCVNISHTHSIYHMNDMPKKKCQIEKVISIYSWWKCSNDVTARHSLINLRRSNRIRDGDYLLKQTQYLALLIFYDM